MAAVGPSAASEATVAVSTAAEARAVAQAVESTPHGIEAALRWVRASPDSWCREGGRARSAPTHPLYSHAAHLLGSAAVLVGVMAAVEALEAAVASRYD